ncbi:membrane-associated, eicosanoid/glutathione metabolism protein [Cladochytrium replicatum]|nr:membrane-associated, eicosanoid/glutathione metabolism protein [Cladochytrium replicatum]
MSSFAIPITALYSGFIGIYAIILQFQVSTHRRLMAVSLGDGTREILIEAIQSLHANNFANIDSKEITTPFGSKYWELTRAVRAHGNFIEAAPMILLFAAIAELNSASPILVHIALATFCVARLLHAAALRTTRAVGLLRAFGFLGSTLPIVALAIFNTYSGIRAVFGL